MSKSMRLTGDKQLEKVFRTLGDRVQRKVLRSAVNVASSPVVRAARSEAPSESGTLKKSLGKKLKTYKQTGTVTAIVGPRTNVVGEWKGKKRWPHKYAHLVESGHITENGVYVPPNPFMAPAWDSTQGQALNTIKDKLAEGTIKEAKKAAGGK